MKLDENSIQIVRDLLSTHSCTLEDLQERASISRRTVFRYLSILKGRGHDVVRVGLTRPTRYRIVKHD